MSPSEAVILVGHGVPASDTPRNLITEFKALEGQRRARRSGVSDRESELDKLLREWPRTPETDPYLYGLEQLAEKLAPRLNGKHLAVAFNEFCAPGVGDTITRLVNDGYGKITLIPTMFTPGGLHSEIEIPEIVEAARRRHPDLVLHYAWPFDLDHVAQFLDDHFCREPRG